MTISMSEIEKLTYMPIMPDKLKFIGDKTPTVIGATIRLDVQGRVKRRVYVDDIGFYVWVSGAAMRFDSEASEYIQDTIDVV